MVHIVKVKKNGRLDFCLKPPPPLVDLVHQNVFILFFLKFPYSFPLAKICPYISEIIRMSVDTQDPLPSDKLASKLKVLQLLKKLVNGKL